MAHRAAQCAASTSRIPYGSMATVRCAHGAARPMQRPRDGILDRFWELQGRPAPLPDHLRPHPINQSEPERNVRRYFRDGEVFEPFENHFPYVRPIDETFLASLRERPSHVDRLEWLRACLATTWRNKLNWQRIKRIYAHRVTNVQGRLIIRSILRDQCRLSAGLRPHSLLVPTTWTSVQPDFWPFYRRRLRAWLHGLAERFQLSWLKVTPPPVEGPLWQYKVWEYDAIDQAWETYRAYLTAIQTGVEQDIQNFILRYEPSQHIINDLREAITARNEQRVGLDISPFARAEIVGVRGQIQQDNKYYASTLERSANSPRAGQVLVRFQTRQTLRTFPRVQWGDTTVDPKTGMQVVRRTTLAEKERLAAEQATSESRDVMQYFIFQRNFGTRKVPNETRWYMKGEVFETRFDDSRSTEEAAPVRESSTTAPATAA